MDNMSLTSKIKLMRQPKVSTQQSTISSLISFDACFAKSSIIAPHVASSNKKLKADPDTSDYSAWPFALHLNRKQH